MRRLVRLRERSCVSCGVVKPVIGREGDDPDPGRAPPLIPTGGNFYSRHAGCVPPGESPDPVADLGWPASPLEEVLVEWFAAHPREHWAWRCLPCAERNPRG